jgi:hypothetical protein
MKSNAIVASSLAVLTAGGLVGETVVSADSADTQCEARACSERPLAIETWSPDMPENENAAHAPPAQLDEINGEVSTNSVPFFGGIDDTTVTRRHRPRWHPAVQPDDSAAWIHVAIMQAQPATRVH